MSIIFYTALFGQHTDLKEFDRKGFQCFCFTDDPELTSHTWTIIQQPRVGTPRMDAKWPKMNPETLGLPLRTGDFSIWVDASIQITDIELMARACCRGDLSLFKHPERGSIGEEVAASIAMPKYANMPLAAQANAYLAEGLPDFNLWAGGVISRRHGVEANVLLGLKWYHECRRWSPQDQISLPYVMWKLDMSPGLIPYSIYKSDFHEHVWTGPSDDNDPHGRAFFGQMRMCRDPYRRLGDAINTVVGKQVSALDIGCGIGLQTKRLQELGWDVIGAEHAPVAVDMREPGVEIIPFDLTSPYGGCVEGGRYPYDCVICTETAEHIPAEHADMIVDNTCHFARETIVWSAAQPEQPWPGHVNLQRPSYWIEKFEKRGWKVDEAATSKLRAIMLATEAQHWRAATNFHIFVRA